MRFEASNTYALFRKTGSVGSGSKQKSAVMLGLGYNRRLVSPVMKARNSVNSRIK